MTANRIQVKQNSYLYEAIYASAPVQPAPELYEIVHYEDVYPTVWAHWGPQEYTVVGYMRDGKLIREHTKKVEKIK
jgi:hypothetical protein